MSAAVDIDVHATRERIRRLESAQRDVRRWLAATWDERLALAHETAATLRLASLACASCEDRRALLDAAKSVRGMSLAKSAAVDLLEVLAANIRRECAEETRWMRSLLRGC